MGIYGWSPGNGGVHHYRIAEPLRVAALHGIEVATGRELDNAVAERFNTILVHMLHHEPALPAWKRLASIGHHRLVLDIDDAMWAPDYEPFREYYTPERLTRLYRAAQYAHVVTTPSPLIAEHLSKANPNVHVVPNTVPAYLLKQTLRRRGGPIVGYQGSASHDPDISEHFLMGMHTFLATHPHWTWRMWGKTPGEIKGWPTGWVETVPWQDSLRTYYRSLSMDIGIGPLKPTTFTASKSSLRAVEYAALGVPAVLSNSPAYTSTDIGRVEHGVTGMLLDEGDSWCEVLAYLAANPHDLIKMGYTAKERAMAWTTENNIDRWVEAWNSA